MGGIKRNRIMARFFTGLLGKGLSRNKPGRILRGFFALDRAPKRNHTSLRKVDKEWEG
jgi:hypothetical protein